MKKAVSFAIFFLIMMDLSAQANPRLAVLPLNANGIAKNEAQVLTGLLETGLVKTESFTVIEQSQMSDILEAQEVTLAGCTDEACAIEMGKLLAAEQIILGEISRLGSRYIANVKIVDITKGSNLKAEKVDADSLEELMDGMEILAYMLAGLVVPSGGSGRVSLATEFGEIFVESDPADAEIYVNGTFKGTTPAVISKIPAGKNHIALQKDNYYGENEVSVRSGEMSEIKLSLKIQKSNLFLKTPDPEMFIYFDGNMMGKVGSGLFKDLPAGKHHIEMLGEELAWQGDVELTSGKTLTVEIFPEEFGSLTVKIPKESHGILIGEDFRQTVKGGETRFPVLFTGKYTLTIEPDRKYEAWMEDIIIQRGSDERINPKLSPTPAYLKELDAQAKEEKRIALTNEILGLEAQVTSLESRIKKADNGGVNILGGLLWGAIAGGSGYGTWYCYEEANSYYGEYKKADTSSKAQDLRAKTEDWKLYSYIGAGVTALSAIFSFANFFPDNSGDSKAELTRELAKVKAELADKEMEKEALN